jgi:hypothetical protein
MATVPLRGAPGDIGLRRRAHAWALGPWIELRIQLRRRKKPWLQEHFCGRKVAVLRLLYKEEEML